MRSKSYLGTRADGGWPELTHSAEGLAGLLRRASSGCCVHHVRRTTEGLPLSDNDAIDNEDVGVKMLQWRDPVPVSQDSLSQIRWTGMPILISLQGRRGHICCSGTVVAPTSTLASARSSTYIWQTAQHKVLPFCCATYALTRYRSGMQRPTEWGAWTDFADI